MGTESKIHDIDLKRRADRATALLALAAAGKQARAGESCLSVQELASLVDGEATADERKHCFNHLAGCDFCYHLWLEISALAGHGAGQKGKNILQQLFQPRVLTWTGSALAAAASVALFLNIRGEVDMPFMQHDMAQKAHVESKSRIEPPPEPVTEEAMVVPVPGLKNRQPVTRSAVRKKDIESSINKERKVKAIANSFEPEDVMPEGWLLPESMSDSFSPKGWIEEKREQVVASARKKSVWQSEQRTRSNNSRLLEQWIFMVKSGCAENQSQKVPLF